MEVVYDLLINYRFVFLYYYFWFCFIKRHTVDLHDSVDERQDQIKSIMERNAIDEFLVSSEMAGRTVCIY